MKGTGRVQVKIDPKEQQDSVVALTIRFDTEILGATRCGLLFAGLVNAMSAVLSEEDRADMLRQLEAERVRLGLGGAGVLPTKK